MEHHLMSLLFCCLAVIGQVDEPYPIWFAETIKEARLPPSIGTRQTPAELAALRDGQPPPPYRDLTTGVRLADGTLWIGSKGGLLYRAPGKQDWRLLHSRRWLMDDHVVELGVAADNAVHVQTATGTTKIVPGATSLARKMTEIHAELRRRHVRDGLVGSIQLKTPGRVEDGYSQADDDNDGLWTSLYVAAETFRFATTGDPQAKKNAWQSLQALMFLEKVTGIPGFVARTFLPITEPKPNSGEWHRSKDGKWWWKGDTSNDELVGHYFAHAVYYDLAATAEEKEQIRRVIARITDHIVDHGLYYVGPSGKPTTWGVWAPEKLNRELRWIGDRGLNSLEVLSHLKVAEHITGKASYGRVARDLIDKHGYALNTVWQKHIWPPEVNHSDDQLAFLAYYPLLRYERDSQLRAIYLASLEYSWVIERPEQSPLFNFIYAASRQAGRWTNTSQRPESPGIEPASYDLLQCVQWFRDVPQDLIDWTVKNSKRDDIDQRVPNRHRHTISPRVLNVAERPLMRWNGDPYQLDGGADGRSRDDGTYILLPYWMGVYHRFLK
jgi:hypothetical protein